MVFHMHRDYTGRTRNTEWDLFTAVNMQLCVYVLSLTDEKI